MNYPLVFALLALLFNAAYDIVFSKKSTSNDIKGMMSFYFLSVLSSSVVSFFLIISLPGGIMEISFSMKDIFYGVIMGITSFFTYYLYLKSFTNDEISINVIIFRMSMIPSIIVSVLFMGEEINIWRALAILTCVLSILLFGTWKSDGIKGKKYLLYSIGACLFCAVLNLVNKIAINNGVEAFKLIFLRFAVTTITVGLIITFKKLWLIEKKNIKFAVLSGILMVFAIFMILSAYKTGDIAAVLPITQLSFILVAFVSWLFFKERMNVKKVTGILLAVVTVLLMK